MTDVNGCAIVEAHIDHDVVVATRCAHVFYPSVLAAVLSSNNQAAMTDMDRADLLMNDHGDGWVGR